MYTGDAKSLEATTGKGLVSLWGGVNLLAFAILRADPYAGFSEYMCLGDAGDKQGHAQFP